MKRNKNFVRFDASLRNIEPSGVLSMEHYELNLEEFSESQTADHYNPTQSESSFIENQEDFNQKEKTHFWESLIQKVKPQQESLPVMIEELQERLVEPSLEYVAKPKSVICAGMVIHGNIDLDGPLSIEGTIFGHVSCNDHVDSKSGNRIHGDVSAQSLFLLGGSITGDVHCQDKVEIDAGSVVFGNLKARTLVIAGRIEGDLFAHDSIRLLSSAVVKGNLKASTFVVEAGAQLNGQCEIKNPELESNDYQA